MPRQRPRVDQRHGRRAAAGRAVFLTLTAVALAAPDGSAQNRVTLADAIERAVARNHDVTIQRENVALADAAADRVLGAYDLLLRIDGRGRVRTDPINSILSGAPVGALAPRTTAVLGAASISQLFSSGASLQAATSIERDTSNSRLALLTPSFLTSASVDFRQPLLQGRQVDPTRRALRLARRRPHPCGRRARPDDQRHGVRRGARLLDAGVRHARRGGAAPLGGPRPAPARGHAGARRERDVA